MEKVLITGTGTIAKKLAFMLDKQGFRVNFLSTSKSYFNKFPCYQWNVANGTIDKAALSNVDHIIHLAGAGIADKRWTHERKTELEESRIKAAHIIFEAIKSEGIQLKTFISASGSNYYGMRSMEGNISEEHRSGDDFIGQLCEKWEQAAFRFQELGSRVVTLRTGMVLSDKGGAIPRLRKVTKALMGAPLGTGNQIVPWIHIDDLVAMYYFCLVHPIEGAINAVAPQKICNRYLMKTLGKILRRPVWFFPVPSFALNAAYGEMAKLLTEGYYLSSDKVKGLGFQFEFPNLEPALEDVLNKK